MPPPRAVLNRNYNRPIRGPQLCALVRAETTASLCLPNGPADRFEWNFSFGNGFEGTNLVANELYVIAYYPDPSAKIPAR